MLLVHIAVYGPKLRAEVAKLARAEHASLVVCGPCRSRPRRCWLSNQ